MADPVLFLKGDSNKHVVEAAIVAAGLATAEGFSSVEKLVPEVSHEATPEAANDSVESEKEEPQREHKVDVTTAPETEDAHPDIHSNLPNDSVPVPLPVEPEIGPIETELVDERQVETTSATSVPIDEDQLEPSSIETAPNTEKDTEEVQTQADIRDELIPESDVAPHTEAADSEGPLEEKDASTKESQITVQLEPDVDSVPTEEEPSTITQVAAEDLLPKIESEGAAISQAPLETIPIPEEATAPVADVEEQIIAPVDVRSEHVAVVAHGVENEVEAETHGTVAATATNELAAAESPETDQPVLPSNEVFMYFIPWKRVG